MADPQVGPTIWLSICFIYSYRYTEGIKCSCVSMVQQALLNATTVLYWLVIHCNSYLHMYFPLP